MFKFRQIFALSALALVAACGNDKQDEAAFKNDNLLMPRPASQQVISPEELGLAAPATAAATPLAPQPTAKPVSTTSSKSTASRSSTTRRSSSTASSSRGTYTPAPAPRTVTVKHTKRDAAIGAGAGAVIGAATSKNKVKGAVIGGVIGGVLGGVIGNNVDVKKVPQY